MYNALSVCFTFIISTAIIPCFGMENREKVSETTKTLVQHDYMTKQYNKLPECIYHQRIKDYCHNYTTIEGEKLPRDQHETYTEQFYRSIIIGGRNSYTIMNNKTDEFEKNNDTPKKYLQSVCSVICFLFSEMLSKNTAECGPKQWSLILDDPTNVWRNFFINGYRKATNEDPSYIKSLTTNHLVNLKLRNHYCITTDISPESIEPFCLPNNDDQILLIPDDTKKWLFIKTGKSTETGWTKISFKGVLNGGISWLGKKFPIFSNNEKEVCNKERVPIVIKNAIAELFPEVSSKDTTFLYQIVALLEKKSNESFGKEKKEKINKLLELIMSKFDHLPFRLGKEIIFDNSEIKSSSLFYALLKNKQESFINSEESFDYYKGIVVFGELKHLIFLHNHGYHEKFSMQDIRNKAEEFIAVQKKMCDAISDNHVRNYLTNTAQILKQILLSKDCDKFLRCEPIFEENNHIKLLEKLEKEQSLKSQLSTKLPNSTEYLELPKDLIEEQE